MADVLSGGAADLETKRRKLNVLSLPNSQMEHMRVETLAWAAANGVLLGAEGPFPHAPCSLLPYPFPASLFAQAGALSRPFNTLVDRVARDTDWLISTVRGVVGHDEFTGELLKICEAVVAEGVVQPLQLGIYRSDYMIDQPTDDAAPRILQVELNTISCSFVSLAAKLSRMHADLVSRWGATNDGAMQPFLSKMSAIAAALKDESLLPPSSSETDVAAAIALAHEEYLVQRGGARQRAAAADVPPTAVLMIVQPNERNVVDQRGIEHALWREHRVPLLRKTLRQVDPQRSSRATVA